MAIITVVGAGMMGSAITIPAAENGHTIRIVGTPLDREIIKHAQNTGEHLTLKRKLPAGISYYQIEALEQAMKDADLLIGGVSSFGLTWFIENIIPKIPKIPNQVTELRFPSLGSVVSCKKCALESLS